MVTQQHYWEWIRAQVRSVQDTLGRTPTVVDIGCGDGNAWRRGWQGRHDATPPPETVPDIDLTGVDADDLDWPWRFVQARAEALPFADATFDVAVLSQILEHVADPVVVVREAGRVVRPGGWIGITVPVGEHPALETDGDRMAQANPWIRYKRFVPDSEFPHHGHVRRYTRLQELLTLVRVVNPLWSAREVIRAHCDGGDWLGAWVQTAEVDHARPAR